MALVRTPPSTFSLAAGQTATGGYEHGLTSAEAAAAADYERYAALVTNPAWQSLIVNTHPDGPNATEENGALGMLALARHLTRQPRQRDMHFAW